MSENENQFRTLYKWKNDPRLADQLVEYKGAALEDVAVAVQLEGWRIDPSSFEPNKEEIEYELDQAVAGAKCAADLDGALLQLVRRELSTSNKGANRS